LIGGSVVGWLFIGEQVKSAGESFMKRFGIILAGLVVVSLAAEFLPISLYPNHDFWKASPEFFFVRFGVVGLLLIVLWHYDRRREKAGKSVMALFGQESLIVYVVHLLVVYGYTYKLSF